MGIGRACSALAWLSLIAGGCGRVGYDAKPASDGGGGLGGASVSGSGGASGTGGVGGTGGTSGVSGSAGTSGMSGSAGASGAGGVMVDASIGGDAMSCVDGGQPCGSIRLQYYVTSMDRPTDAWARPHFNVVNDSASTVPLTELTVRYWYTEETPLPQSMACDFAGIGCQNLTGTFIAVSPGRTGADEVFELSFLAGAGDLAPGGQTGEMGLRFSKSDFSSYNEADDYSYNDTLGALTDYPKVTVYRNGVLVWGVEPP